MGRIGPGLASVPLQDHPGRHDREDPDRAHGDDERPDGIAGGVRVAVEGLEDEDGAVQEHDQGNTYARERFPVHRQGNGRSPAPIVLGMAAFFGFHMPTFTFRGVSNDRLFDRVVENAKAAERAGFDLVTVMDHLYQIRGIGPETEPMMEAYTTLSALATQTSRVKLGTLVTGVTYRNPALLAKMVTTLDVISKGRAILGVGAAWNEDEHRGYGFEFPPIARRMDRLDEALTIARLMFTEERPSFEGKYYRIDRAVNVPRPIQPGGPKILVGGGGERRTLRLLAQHGDIGHWFGGNLEDLKRKKQVFEQHCEAVNRDPSEVLLTVGLTLVLAENEKDARALMEGLSPERRAMAQTANVAEAAEVIGKYLDAGFGGFTFNNNVLQTPESMGLAGEVIKAVRGSGVPA
ncbi:MAG: LLM class F420-dependent oxidoreductase [Chloroflexi bacterium]|nr:MAG: LLM class F420-dependent oxidoreductase [Chloroflexota bacterium]